jgi:hypothetical protein
VGMRIPLIVSLSYSQPTSTLWPRAERTDATIAAAPNEVPPSCASKSFDREYPRDRVWPLCTNAMHIGHHVEQQCTCS